jgi:hypothetical protein
LSSEIVARDNDPVSHILLETAGPAWSVPQNGLTFPPLEGDAPAERANWKSNLVSTLNLSLSRAGKDLVISAAGLPAAHFNRISSCDDVGDRKGAITWPLSVNSILVLESSSDELERAGET